MSEVRAKDDFNQIYSKFFRPVFLSVYGLIGNREDAEEIAQDAFMNFFRKNTSYPSMDDAGCHLIRCAKNLALNFLKHKKIEKKHKSELVSEMPAPSDEIAYIHFIVDKALSRNPTLSEVFALRVFSSLSYYEIASVLSLPVSAVKTRLYRARVLVREEFEKEGITI